MLRVSVYNPFQSGEVQHIGKNGLINVHSGHVNWNTQFDLEIEDRLGKLLVSGEFSSTIITGVANMELSLSTVSRPA
jgi:hypothetical protein